MRRATRLLLALALPAAGCAPGGLATDTLAPAPAFEPVARYPGPCLEDEVVDGAVVRRTRRTWSEGRPVAVEVLRPGMGTVSHQTFTYTDGLRTGLVEVRLPAAPVRYAFEWGPGGRLLAELRGLDEADRPRETVRYRYDDAGRLLERVTEANGRPPRRTTYAYDEAGRVLRAVDDDGRTTTYAYDDRGDVHRRTVEVPGAPPAVFVTTSRYDDAGRPAERRETRDGVLTGLWRHGHDTFGNLRWTTYEAADTHTRRVYSYGCWAPSSPDPQVSVPSA